MKQIQVLFKTPVLLNTSEEWRYHEKCFKKKDNLKVIHTIK
jgi:hypothetical protein